MIGTKERRTAIKLENLRDMWNYSGLHMVILLASLYLSLTASKGLSISGKALREIMRTKIKSLRIVSMIASLHRQCYEGMEVS